MRAIYLVNYASNAVGGLIRGSDREAAVNAVMESVGGKLESIIFTRGEFDAVVIVDVPDRNTAVALAMAVETSGDFKRNSLLEELDMKQIIPIAQNVVKVYEPAGQ